MPGLDFRLVIYGMRWPNQKSMLFFLEKQGKFLDLLTFRDDHVLHMIDASSKRRF